MVWVRGRGRCGIAGRGRGVVVGRGGLAAREQAAEERDEQHEREHAGHEHEHDVQHAEREEEVDDCAEREHRADGEGEAAAVGLVPLVPADAEANEERGELEDHLHDGENFCAHRGGLHGERLAADVQDLGEVEALPGLRDVDADGADAGGGGGVGGAGAARAVGGGVIHGKSSRHPARANNPAICAQTCDKTECAVPRPFWKFRAPASESIVFNA